MLVVTLSLLLDCLWKIKGESGREGTDSDAIAGKGAEAPLRIGSAVMVALELEDALAVNDCGSPSVDGSSSVV